MTVEANSSPPIHQRSDGIGLEAFAIGEIYEIVTCESPQQSAAEIPACTMNAATLGELYKPEWRRFFAQ